MPLTGKKGVEGMTGHSIAPSPIVSRRGRQGPWWITCGSGRGASRLRAVAYDADLAERVRRELVGTSGVTELTMFGGWGVTIRGNMAVGIMGGDLIVRVGPDSYDTALKRVGVRPFDFTGRSMTGWVYVGGTAVKTHRGLVSWVERGVAYASSLPPKTARKSRSSGKV